MDQIQDLSQRLHQYSKYAERWRYRVDHLNLTGLARLTLSLADMIKNHFYCHGPQVDPWGCQIMCFAKIYRAMTVTII